MYSIGIDLGGTSTKLAAVTSSGEIRDRYQQPAVAGESLPHLFARLRPELERMAAGLRLPYPPPGGVGAGVAAIVDHQTGWLKLAGNLNVEDCDLRGAAEAALGCPVAVECDGNAGALADLYWGQAQQATNLLYITWGTGIGSGLALDRRLYRSRNGSMGEFGHTPVECADPQPCYCGCRGCLETEASGLAIETRMSRQLGRPVTIRELAAAAASGDQRCRQALEVAAGQVARALAGALVLLNPDCVVIGGGVSHCLPLVRAAFDRELELHAPPFARQHLTVALSNFPGDAGVLGAALLPRHQSEEDSIHAAKSAQRRP
jgi:glucokinase